ncbi:MAG: hypothetical protein M1826_006173 [Phylliscum demangeonii]|nr:MAG: hypothetical protein M1826_006173 [Phylliscum demangeonii]
MAAPLSAAELMAHPAYKHAIWDLPPTTKGRATVGAGRGGPFQIAYEIHGHGPIRIAWIMGLGALKTAWQRQTKSFGHDQADRYRCLIWDNRGMGESDRPLVRYSTSEMARDAVELWDHVGWTQDRGVHVVGVSMGGMIAQELALMVPERIASLSLVSTAARLVNTTSFLENLQQRINLFIPRSLDEQLHLNKALLFSRSWLAAADDEAEFPTNGDHFAAQELHKRTGTGNSGGGADTGTAGTGFTRTGFILQAVAAGWHHKTPAQVRRLAARVGRRRILVVHGSADRMITVPHAHTLQRELDGEEELAPGREGTTDEDADEKIQCVVFEGKGHVLLWEMRSEFTALVEGLIARTEALNAEGGG